MIRWSDSGAGRLIELRSGTVDQITNIAAGSEVASHFTPCSITNACEGESWYDFDAAKARQMLADAGFPNGFKTKIVFRDEFRGYLPEPSVVAVEFQTQLRDNLGIEAEVVVMESGEFIDESTNGRLDGFYLLGWGADYPHVTNFLDFHFSGKNPQYGKTHPEIYKVLEEASTIADVAEARPLYAKANNAIKALVPMLPIAHGASASAALATVDNAHFRPFGAPLFHRADPKKDIFAFKQNAEPISLYCADETDGESCRYVSRSSSRCSATPSTRARSSRAWRPAAAPTPIRRSGPATCGPA